MSKNFVPGTTTNKTVKEIDALIVAGLKTHCRISAQSVEPAQRKPRADKGKSRKDATTATSTTSKAS